MVVCKKVRFLTKDAKGKLYVKSDNFQILRNRAVIQESTVQESEHSFPETGILWVVDEEATKEWNEAKRSKNKPNKKESDNLQFDGLEVTEDNIDDFIKDNKIDIGKTSTPHGKLSKVEKWIKSQNK